MNTKQTKREFIALKVIALTLSLLVLAGIALYCFTTRPGTYTVYADDGYYSETTYYLTEAAYERGVPLDERISLGEENDFALAVQKDVWVYESTDENGVVTESRLLGKEEAEQAEAVFADTAIVQNAEDTTLIDEDSESWYRLSTYFYVSNNNLDGYTLHGAVSWQNLLAAAWETEKAAEEENADYLCLSWGGGESLYKESDSASATYYNNQEVEISKCIDETREGVIWQFHEKSGWLGKELKQGDFYVNLVREYASMGRLAQAQMTYVHTYKNYEGVISLEAGIKDGGVSLAAGVSLSKEDHQWQIQMGLECLEY